MAATRTGRPETRSTSKATLFNAAAIDHAVCLIHQVCCLAGFFDLVEEFRDQALSAAIERHDSAVLFDRLMFDFSFQGISDEIAINYMRRYGQATWHSVRKNLTARPSCPKLQSYWHFHDCRYEKTSRTCAEPDHIDTCPLPTHPLRNGHLNQIAYSLYLFIRDVGEGDLVGWIDDRLDQTNESGPDALAQACNGLIGRVGPGNFTPSLSQIPDVNLSIHPARATARRLPPSIVHRAPPAAGHPTAVDPIQCR
jgi:hypothetical protein